MDGRTILTHARHCAIASMYEKRRNMTVSGLSCKQVGVKPISEKSFRRAYNGTAYQIKTVPLSQSPTKTQIFESCYDRTVKKAVDRKAS